MKSERNRLSTIFCQSQNVVHVIDHFTKCNVFLFIFVALREGQMIENRYTLIQFTCQEGEMLLVKAIDAEYVFDCVLHMFLDESLKTMLRIFDLKLRTLFVLLFL